MDLVDDNSGTEFWESPDPAARASHWELRAELWKIVVSGLEQGDAGWSMRAIQQLLGIHRIAIGERLIVDPANREADHLSYALQSHIEDLDPAQLDSFESEWRAENVKPPPYTSRGSLLHRFRQSLKPVSFREFDPEEMGFFAELHHFVNDYFGLPGRDIVLLPLPDAEQGRRIRIMGFHTDYKVEEFEPFLLTGMAVLNAIDYHRVPGPAEPTCELELAEKTREIVYWAVKGKTVHEISTITGFGVKSVRYHLYKLREEFGFATVTQTLVQAAKRFGFDP